MKPIHPLRRWLFEHQQTLSVFAKKVGTSQGYVSEWLTGKRLPSMALAAEVARVTQGAITANDFVAFKAACEKPKKRRAA